MRQGTHCDEGEPVCKLGWPGVCKLGWLGEHADFLSIAEKALCRCAMPSLLCRMYRALYYGASPDVFVNGDLGIGWQKVGAARASRAAPGLGAGALELLLRRLHTQYVASCLAPLWFPTCPTDRLHGQQEGHVHVSMGTSPVCQAATTCTLLDFERRDV